MIALYTFRPLRCPCCGTPTGLDSIGNPLREMYEANQALTCSNCGLMYQLTDKKDALRAATASSGNLAVFFDREDDEGA